MYGIKTWKPKKGLKFPKFFWFLFFTKKIVIFVSYFKNKKIIRHIIEQAMKIRVINQSPFELPSYATEGSAGVDLRANIEHVVTLKPMERKVIPTGLFMELPIGYEAQIRPRSGLALKKGLSIPNAPGTIDSDYRGEIGVILVNLSDQPIEIEKGARIAQMVIAKYEQIEWESTDELGSSDRGKGGYGSTGKH